MDTSSAGAGCPNQVSKKTVDRETWYPTLRTTVAQMCIFGVSIPSAKLADVTSRS